ncbi:MAG: restriction endonuclease [Desulfurococcales archaeon]|nr:restriction endonuclease [Desulfurococcales archaeon]
MRGRHLRASEALAARLLEELGYRVLGVHVPVTVNGVEVSDIDIVAERGGERYAVEVKAGAIDVSGLRQAYVNAVLTGMKPLVVARGYSGDEARALASRLGVEVILLPDVVAAGADEVREITREAVADALAEVIGRLVDCPSLGEEDWRLLEAIASEGGLPGAAERLGLSLEEAARRVASLRRSGVLRWTGRGLVLEARILLLCRRLEACSLGAPSR